MSANSVDVSFILNGRKVSASVAPDATLFDFLRSRGISSVKCACETTNCGLCTVWLDGRAILSCAELVARVDGHEVTTLEGLEGESAALARAMAEEGAEQCGFCSPGLIMNVLALARAAQDDPSLVATREDLSRNLAGNLCRCTGYESQLRAIVRYLISQGVDIPFEMPAVELGATHAEGARSRSTLRFDPSGHDAVVRSDDEGFSQVTDGRVKKDSAALLAGKPLFTADLAPANSLVVKLLRSPHAFATISSIDTSRAMRVPGVVAVYTYEDVPQVRFTLAGQSFPEPSPYDRLVLDRMVRYVGDEVAIVAAETPEAADRALRLIRVEYDVHEPVLDPELAIDHPSVVHPEDDIHLNYDAGGDIKRNLVAHGVSEVGDLDAAFAQSEVVLERAYRTQAAQQAMMETFRAFATIDAQGRVSVTSSTQVPFHVRRQVAAALQIPQSQVQVIKPRVGGGFGAKQSGCCEIFAAFVAHRTGRPALCSYTRQETFAASNARHAMDLKVRIGAKRDGTIMAIDLHALSNAGAYGEHATTTIGLVGHKSLPIYNHVMASRFSYDVVYTNTSRGGAYRGYGATQGCFAVESAVNELADELGMDPAELRLKNLVQEGEVMPQYYNEPLRSCKLDECIRRAKEMIGWDEKGMVRDLGDSVRGLGLAVTMQGSGISNIDIGSIDLRLEEDGFITLGLGATDCGTGCDTIVSQIAAEELGVDADIIVVRGVDTDSSPFDTGAYASSGTYITGMAAARAAAQLREQICAKAATWWGVDASEVSFDGAHVCGAGNSLTLREFANKCVGGGEGDCLTAHAAASSPVSPPPFMAGAVEVDVEKATGKVTVVDYVGVVDCGTVVNRNLARVQAEGGIAQGIGMALTEDVQRSAAGRMRTDSFMTYKLPTRLDIPQIRVDFRPSFEPTGPFGAKSIGEVVINTPSPAIASAVAHATGRYVRSLPITPEKALFGEGE
ncbi:MAG: molybdopterin cofactor-binding domain-containing protein [Collinsella sp.]|nr:molybdopterin cofactor-binding domain-containing protein [Collinsella sp.]